VPVVSVLLTVVFCLEDLFKKDLWGPWIVFRDHFIQVGNGNSYDPTKFQHPICLPQAGFRQLRIQVF
jgi:hypothetical protein